jgi:glutathione-independent formaldehyde dehydrogenase
VDAVGYPMTARAEDPDDPATVLDQLVDTVRPTGGLGVPGNGVRPGPGGDAEKARRDMLPVTVGTLFEKGLRLGTGEANVKRYDRQLRDMITEGRARPSFVVSHELPLDEAPDAYRESDKRAEGYIKIVLRPDAGWSPRREHRGGGAMATQVPTERVRSDRLRGAWP